jgi:hypothetical protein
VAEKCGQLTTQTSRAESFQTVSVRVPSESSQRPRKVAIETPPITAKSTAGFTK